MSRNEHETADADLELAFTAYGDAEAQAVRSALEAAGIPVMLRCEAITRAYPVTVDGLGAVRVLVPADRLEEAREILETPAATLGDSPEPGAEKP